MAGRKRGPAEKRTGRQRAASTSNVVQLHQGGRLPVPEPDERWLDPVKERWAGFWASELAQLATPETVPALRRLHDLYNERALQQGAVEKSGVRLVQGSQGQTTLNPLLRHIATLDGEIRQMEDRFGLTPLARLQLGVALGGAAKSLEEMNAAFVQHHEEGDEEQAPEAGNEGVIDV